MDYYFTIFLLLFISIGVVSIYIPAFKNKKIRESIYSERFISYREFEKNWISAKHGNKGLAGYKYNDRPGCYVITIFDNPVLNGDYTQYKNIYIGQSIKMCKRVHDHFNGKGNGEVYADIKYGKHAYVRLVPCSKENLNNVEKKLIRAFNATNSYNKTRGGAKRT